MDFIISLLMGLAARWATPLLTQPGSLLDDFSGFYVQLKSMFEDPVKAQTANRWLWELKHDSWLPDERFNELGTVLNQSKEDIQIQATSLKLDTQLGGSLEESEGGINSKYLITVEMIEWMSNELDLFRKADGICRIDLLYAATRQLLRDIMFKFAEKSTEQQVLEIFSMEIHDFDK